MKHNYKENMIASHSRGPVVNFESGVIVELSDDAVQLALSLKLGSGSLLDPIRLDPLVVNNEDHITIFVANSIFDIGIKSSSHSIGEVQLQGVQLKPINRFMSKIDYEQFKNVFKINRSVGESFNLNSIYLNVDGNREVVPGKIANNISIDYTVQVSLLLSFLYESTRYYGRVDPLVKISTGG